VTPGGPWAVFLPGPKGYPSASFFFSNSFLFFFSDFFCRNCKNTPIKLVQTNFEFFKNNFPYCLKLTGKGFDSKEN
jgi:hypothetical protein